MRPTICKKGLLCGVPFVLSTAGLAQQRIAAIHEVAFPRAVQATTIEDGLRVEMNCSELGWLEANGDAQIAVVADDPQRLEITAPEGWITACSYRVRVTPYLLDEYGQPFDEITFPLAQEQARAVPKQQATQPAPSPILSREFPVEFDVAAVAANTVGGRFPGGQTFLFQGFWTDPVTGLSYARGRWYDARTASWLSEDPLDDIDSPNLYAFVGWRPNEFVDPLGLYQRDFHVGMTEYLARLAGFRRPLARSVALAAGMPDEDQRDPFATGRVLRAPVAYSEAQEHEAAASIRRWHFPLTCRGAAEGAANCQVVPDSREARAEYRAGIRQGDFRRFGEGLHPLQDSFSHQGVSGWHYHDEDDEVFAGYGHPEARGGPYRTQADLPNEFPADAMEAAQATFQALLEWRIEREGLTRSDADRLRLEFEEARDEIGEWIELPTREAREQWLTERGIDLQ